LLDETPLGSIRSCEPWGNAVKRSRMYGSHDIPFIISKDGLSISVEKEGENFVYRREYNQEKEARVLLLKKGKILINPVEPVNKPKEITSYLLIDFETPVKLGPKVSRRLFLKFPIELGVFLSENDNCEILDIITMTRQKYTLYGDPRNGVICRYWKSNIYSSVPSVNPYYEGVMELNMTNYTARWDQVHRAVFDAYGMKIYYNDEIVSMKANMRIISEELAETDFHDSPLRADMKKSVEYYTSRKIPVLTTKFVMEWGT
jgi:hypothetical protein